MRQLDLREGNDVIDLIGLLWDKKKELKRLMAVPPMPDVLKHDLSEINGIYILSTIPFDDNVPIKYLYNYLSESYVQLKNETKTTDQVLDNLYAMMSKTKTLYLLLADLNIAEDDIIFLSHLMLYLFKICLMEKTKEDAIALSRKVMYDIGFQVGVCNSTEHIEQKHTH